MSAFGPKRTFHYVAFDVAFGGKADMTVCENPLSRSLLGIKQTWRIAVRMSAYGVRSRSHFFVFSSFNALAQPTLTSSLCCLRQAIILTSPGATPAQILSASA